MIVDTLPTRIVRYPDPRLRRKCVPVEVFDESLADLVERMLDLMKSNAGIGLAAPQVGICRRLFVCNPTGEPGDDQVFVNPELSDLTGMVESDEGCLSLPEVRVVIKRARRCRIQAFDLTGQPVEAEGQDLLARIWQHETDHLYGRLIVDRMSPTDQIANKKLLAEFEADYLKAKKPARR